MEQVPNGGGSGFVSYGATAGHLSQVVCAAADQRSQTSVVAKGAMDGDLVVFYFTRPVEAFLGYGRVVRWWQEKWNERPLAEIGMIRLFPVPVSLKRAKERLALPWLKVAQGFGRRRQENVAMLLSLGGVTWAHVLPADRAALTSAAAARRREVSQLTAGDGLAELADRSE
jgi:hypothetical protein